MTRLLIRSLPLYVLACGSAHAALLCTVSTLPVAFSSYDSLSASPVDATGQVNVSCLGLLSSISYTISLSSGTSGSFSPRQMALGGNRLNYNLYRDSARTAVWGDSAANWLSDSYSSLIGATKSYSVYARLPGSQHVPAGAYADSVIVTVNY